MSIPKAQLFMDGCLTQEGFPFWKWSPSILLGGPCLSRISFSLHGSCCPRHGGRLETRSQRSAPASRAPAASLASREPYSLWRGCGKKRLRRRSKKRRGRLWGRGTLYLTHEFASPGWCGTWNARAMMSIVWAPHGTPVPRVRLIWSPGVDGVKGCF